MSAPDPAAAIEVRGLDIVVNRPDGQRTVIVEDISFSIPRGEVLALIGESGSGKTTIALAMLGYSRFGADITADCLRVGDMRIDRMRQTLAHHLGVQVFAVRAQDGADLSPNNIIPFDVTDSCCVRAHQSVDLRS